MAEIYTEGYREGFAINGMDISKKKLVNIRYSIGFERMMRAAVRQFRAMGLEPVIYRYAVHSINKRQMIKIATDRRVRINNMNLTIGVTVRFIWIRL